MFEGNVVMRKELNKKFQKQWNLPIAFSYILFFYI